jgi:hypothetical protein
LQIKENIQSLDNTFCIVNKHENLGF